jgi:DNA uptake protein ComE-like DNA-binding protein
MLVKLLVFLIFAGYDLAILFLWAASKLRRGGGSAPPVKAKAPPVKAKALPVKAKAHARPADGAPAAAVVRLNSVTFEELRSMKLSVTQAKRLIAVRDQVAGFDSLDQLDAVHGFPRALIAGLKRAFLRDP